MDVDEPENSMCQSGKARQPAKEWHEVYACESTKACEGPVGVNLPQNDVQSLGVADPPQDEEPLMKSDPPAMGMIWHDLSLSEFPSMRSHQWLSEECPATSPPATPPSHPSLAGKRQTLLTSHGSSTRFPRYKQFF